MTGHQNQQGHVRETECEKFARAPMQEQTCFVKYPEVQSMRSFACICFKIKGRGTSSLHKINLG